MEVSKKKFDFLAFTVEVWLTDSAPIGFREEAIAGVFHLGFILYFTGVL